MYIHFPFWYLCLFCSGLTVAVIGLIIEVVIISVVGIAIFIVAHVVAVIAGGIAV